jgi:predicted nucleic acid-binding protein
VREEFRKSFQSRKLLARVVADLAPYQYCNRVDEISLKLLRGLTPRKPRSDEGEAEAVLQAAEIGAETVIVDDARGRRWATSRGIKCVGILGIIEALRMQDIVPSISPLLEILAKSGYHLPEADVTKLRERFRD